MNNNSTSPGHSFAQNMRGAGFMTLSMLGFAANDTIIKSFSDGPPMSQILVLRGFFAISLVLAAGWYLGQLRSPRHAFQPLMVLRSAAEIVATYCFLTGLFHLPLANVSAVMQALPLTVALGALLVFRERIGWRRMLAILIGLAGVLIIIRPGFEGFSIYSVYVLGAVAACTVRDLVTRKLPADMPSLFVALVTASSVMAFGGVLSFGQTWQPVDGTQIFLLACSSVFVMTGFFFIIAAMRVGDIGFVGPFRYLLLLFSVLGGLVFYAEVPDMLTLLGSAVVVATGIYTLYRERVIHRQAITPRPTRL